MLVPLAAVLDHAITLRDLLWPAGIGLIALVVIGGLVWLLSVFGDAFKH